MVNRKYQWKKKSALVMPYMACDMQFEHIR